MPGGAKVTGRVERIIPWKHLTEPRPEGGVDRAAFFQQRLIARCVYFSAQSNRGHMDHLTIFGLIAVTSMLLTYALEKRSAWFILAFAGACVLGSIYGFLQGAWPFGMVEAVLAIVAARRWIVERKKTGP